MMVGKLVRSKSLSKFPFAELPISVRVWINGQTLRSNGGII
jgi:hypothetical protein